MALVLLGFAALLGAGAASADTLVSNLGQTTGSFVSDLATEDVGQKFTTGATAATLSEVKVKFNPDALPANTDTVTAVIATPGVDAMSSILATLTSPATWSEISTFTAPAGTTLAASTHYNLIMEGTGGEVATTASDNEDSGGATG